MSSDIGAENPYEPLSPRNYRPFHQVVYGQVLPSPDTSIINYTTGRGFPRQPVPIKQWVPGVSTPEGLILASAAAVAAAETLGVTGELLVKAVNGAAALLLATTVVGIPAGAVWIGEQLMGK